ncbi:uncharacterized protein LOC122250844 [Penaeus japonicus]|uniref:uncharacterized protein LOC122250844 n=1 Tax=Penaeus japonicus TaxID=27405 RepID=UPI001C714F21|nr:uncharacterized protein LOC122250844 [Penaeus japonicus]
MEETLRRLEEEHKKAEAEAHAAEGEAAEAKASWSEARRHHETLQKKHRAMEARIRHLQSELAQQQALSAEHRQGMATACLLLAHEEEIKAAVKEADSQTAGLDSVARMHMGYYDMVQQKCLATSSLSQQVLKARARVMSLKTHLKSFKHSPCMVEPLMLQIQHLKEAVQSLRQQAQSPDESFQSLREETEAAQQDVRAYRRRNKDYMEKLKAQLGCLSARNARMNLDLSGVEKEVCKIRDRIEGKNM